MERYLVRDSDAHQVFVFFAAEFHAGACKQTPFLMQVITQRYRGSPRPVRTAAPFFGKLNFVLNAKCESVLLVAMVIALKSASGKKCQMVMRILVLPHLVA